MEIKETLVEYKGYIIMIALGMGLLSILGKLPESLLVEDRYTKIFYIATIGLAVYCYYNFHWGKNSAPAGMPPRSVQSRSLSNPEFMGRLKEQRGSMPEPRQSNIVKETSGSPNTPSRETFDTFKRN